MKKFLLIILTSCAAIVGCQKVSLSLPAVTSVKVGGTATVQMQICNDFNNEVKIDDYAQWEATIVGDDPSCISVRNFLVTGEKEGSCMLTYKYKPLNISATTNVIVTK